MAAQRDGNYDTLTHAAGILEGILVKTVGRIRDTDAVHHLDGLLLCLGLGDLLVLFDDFGDLRADGTDGVEGGHGVLEDRGDLRAADAFPVLICPELGQIRSVEHDGAVRDRSVGLQHARKGLREHRFAGAGLADDGKGLALIQIQGNIPDGREILVANAELDLDVFCGNDYIFCFVHYPASLLTYAYAGQPHPRVSDRRYREKWRGRQAR